MQKTDVPVFSTEVPPDLEHAPQIREEAFDWLDTHFPGVLSFKTGEVLKMGGENGRRWLIARLRERGIGDEELFNTPAAADALTVLYLRSRGVKFREAVDAVLGGERSTGSAEPRYGGVWNRLVVVALARLRRRVPPRLLGSAVFSIVRDPKDHPNCLLVVKRLGKGGDKDPSDRVRPVTHDYVWRTILERPAPSCSVVAPSLEVLFFEEDELPSRSEVTSRHFVGLQVTTEREVYELLLGTMRPALVAPDGIAMKFVGRILDIAFLDFEELQRTPPFSKFETAVEPEPGAADDLQLWLLTQFLDTIYGGALCDVIETTESSLGSRALASSATKPWEPALWDPPKSPEMLSGYASRVGVPLVVDKVEHPWTLVIKSAEPEMRYLRSRAPDGGDQDGFSAMALPIISRTGDSIGSLYLLMPQLDPGELDVEVRILTVFSRVVGEIIERQRAGLHSATVSVDIATSTILKREQFKGALLDMLTRKAVEIGEYEHLQRDTRLPFLLLAAHQPDPEEFDPAISGRLKDWLVDTLRHVEWRSFLRAHWAGSPEVYGPESFIGELPGVGMMIALGKLVSKDELDRIRNAFPTILNRISPTNSPVKLLTWVLDVPSQRILDAATSEELEGLADDVQGWASDVATVVDDVAQTTILAHEHGEWDEALRKVRKALQKEGGRTNAYLRRIAADCSFSLGEWPSALKYAQEAVALDRREPGERHRPLVVSGGGRLSLYVRSRAGMGPVYRGRLAGPVPPAAPLLPRSGAAAHGQAPPSISRRAADGYCDRDRGSRGVGNPGERGDGGPDRGGRPARPLGADPRVVPVQEFPPGTDVDGAGSRLSTHP